MYLSLVVGYFPICAVQIAQAEAHWMANEGEENRLTELINSLVINQTFPISIGSLEGHNTNSPSIQEVYSFYLFTMLRDKIIHEEIIFGRKHMVNVLGVFGFHSTD